MNISRIAPILFLISSYAVFGQSNVAVLNATLGEGVPSNAATIVADTINEQFVKSSAYRAIDRTYITNIQEEKNFQLSGDVKDEDIQELGATFGADFICIANVSLLGSTYSVSARLIEVETAQVYAQESHREAGKIDVLFGVAEVVGAELTEGTYNSTLVFADEVAVAAVVEEEAVEEIPEQEEGWDYAESEESKGPQKVITYPRSLITFSWLFPAYSGDEDNIYWIPDYSIYESDLVATEYVGFDDAANNHIGLNFNMIFPVWKYIYVGGGLTYTRQKLVLTDPGVVEKYTNFITFEPYIALGGVIAFFDIFQVYGGITGGALLFVLGNGYSDDATDSLWGDNGGTPALGFSLGFEIGIAAYMSIFCLDLHYKWSESPALTSESNSFIDTAELNGDDTSFGVNGITLGLGFAF